jgi:hypothetical protein
MAPVGKELLVDPAANSGAAVSQPGSSSQHTSPSTRVGGNGLLGELIAGGEGCLGETIVGGNGFLGTETRLSGEERTRHSNPAVPASVLHAVEDSTTTLPSETTRPGSMMFSAEDGTAHTITMRALVVFNIIMRLMRNSFFYGHSY